MGTKRHAIALRVEFFVGLVRSLWRYFNAFYLHPDAVQVVIFFAVVKCPFKVLRRNLSLHSNCFFLEFRPLLLVQPLFLIQIPFKINSIELLLR